MALDLMLKTFLTSTEFTEMADKNWNAIAKLLPGTTARQCQRRYEDLLKENVNTGPCILTLTRASSSPNVQPKTSKVDSEAAEVKGPSRPSSAKVKGTKPEKDRPTGKADNRPGSADQGPVMVIHVCDEAKNLKQDFQCPRDLLIREMKYFAEYLSTDAQRWEEVDISVHCDVQIFEWLMKYVKRQNKDLHKPPNLEPTNVISILISSDFLKMDNLVQECIEFCHKNMSAIVATPCNMNCINDRLVGRIADLFSHNEADDIKDRKDKFKSKLFAKKLEKLFDPNSNNSCSPENASTIFRCSVCKRILTKTLQSGIKCLQSRMMVDRKGQLCYTHVRDPSWDVNDYLLELKAQVKTWREVYWRVWGTINALTCSRCDELFQCTELGWCRYHSESAQYDGAVTNSKGAVGVYPCCGLKVLRFDPTQPNKGCKVQDHLVSFPVHTSSPGAKSSSSSECSSTTEVLLDAKQVERQHGYEDLLSHREPICVSFQRLVSQTTEDLEADVFAVEEQMVGVTTGPGTTKAMETHAVEETAKTDVSKPSSTQTGTSRPAPRLQALTIEREVSYDDDCGFGESDDEFGDDEDTGKPRRIRPRRSRVTVDPQAILLDAPDFSTTKTRKWDSSRSMRWNQDAQREEDERRMKEIIAYLTRLRINSDRIDKLKQKEYSGGIYCKLEAQWKTVNAPPPKATNPQLRNKPRLTQLVNK